MAELPPKIKILKGAEPDLSAATYQIHDESHTVGNALRWMLMKNPKVEFCGYRCVPWTRARTLLFSTHIGLRVLNIAAWSFSTPIVQKYWPCARIRDVTDCGEFVKR